MRKQLFTLMVVCFLAAGSRAQSLIHFSTFRFNPITASPNDSLSVSDSLVYSGSSRFTGGIELRMKLDTLSPTVLDSFPQTSLDSLHPFQLFNINLRITPQYQIGPNTVVIWPVYNGGQASRPDDTIVFHIYVYYTGIEESPLSRLYLYQRDGAMFINFGETENLVKQVRLYDAMGREIYSDAADRSRRIVTGQWQSGVYFCEITTVSGQRKVIKLKIDN